MKIKYKFVDGTVSEVEVEDSIGGFIVGDRRREGNLARKEGYHCYSLDAVEFEGMDFAAEGTPETILATLEEDRRVYEAFHKLSEVQQKRLLMLAGGMSIREIARQEGTNFRTVHNGGEAVKAAEGLSEGISDVMNGLAEDMKTSIPTDFHLDADASVRSVTDGMTGAAGRDMFGFASLITIQQMIVRSEDDIRKISQELYNLIQTGSRAGGRIITA